jgi:bloom syndrome protein
MNSLDEHRRELVNDFVANARQLGSKIQFNKSLRDQPFSDTILRAIAINNVKSPEQLLRVEGVRPEMVAAHGQQYLRILHNLEEIYGMGPQESQERPHDPNHVVVVDLVSEDEEEDNDYGGDIDIEDLEAEEEDDGEEDEEKEEVMERSSYFAQRPTLAAQPAVTHTQSVAARAWMNHYDSMNATVPKRRLPWQDESGAKQAKSPPKRKSSSGYQRKASGGKQWPFKGKATNAGVKKGTTKKRKSSEGGTRSRATGGPSRGGAGGSSRGIGAMPT